MDELDEILEKEEELYDDLIEPSDKRITRHPLFMFLAIIALIAILFFALNYFFTSYIPWKREKTNRSTTPIALVLENPDLK